MGGGGRNFKGGFRQFFLNGLKLNIKMVLSGCDGERPVAAGTGPGTVCGFLWYDGPPTGYSGRAFQHPCVGLQIISWRGGQERTEWEKSRGAGRE